MYHVSYHVWLLKYEVQQTKFFVILGHFLPLNPTNNPKNQKLEEMKKAPGGIINSHMCTKNYDQMMYSS